MFSACAIIDCFAPFAFATVATAVRVRLRPVRLLIAAGTGFTHLMFFRLCNHRLLRSLRFRYGRNGGHLRSSHFAPAHRSRLRAAHSILLFCGTVLTLTRTWLSQATCLFGCPDFPHEI